MRRSLASLPIALSVLAVAAVAVLGMLVASSGTALAVSSSGTLKGSSGRLAALSRIAAVDPIAEFGELELDLAALIPGFDRK